MDRTTLNLDPDPELWPNLDSDPGPDLDPGLPVLMLSILKNIYKYF